MVNQEIEKRILRIESALSWIVENFAGVQTRVEFSELKTGLTPQHFEENKKFFGQQLDAILSDFE